MKIVITGSNGFTGSKLSQYFESQNHELILLSRNPVGSNAHYWNPDTQRIDPLLLEGADIVIHLSGENILGRWTQKKKEQIKESRYISTQFLCATLLKLSSPPKLYIGASAVGYYGDRGEEILDESSPPGTGFLAEVCQYWERIPEVLHVKGIRTVLTRFGVVLGAGGALQHMKKAFRSGMGGVLGNGKQIMSWIAIDDVCHAITHVIDHSELQGAVNFVSPQAVTNQEFTKILGKILNRPTWVPIPKLALTAMFGEGAEMFLASTNVRPKRLLETGYLFKFSDVESALNKYIPATSGI